MESIVNLSKAAIYHSTNPKATNAHRRSNLLMIHLLLMAYLKSCTKTRDD